MESRREHAEFNAKQQSAYDFACEWYNVNEIHRCINRRLGGHNIPVDVTSHEFAEWLTEQYRLAMIKGIQIGRSGQ